MIIEKVTLPAMEYRMLLKIFLLADEVSNDLRKYGTTTGRSLELEQAVTAYKEYEKRDTPTGKNT